MQATAGSARINLSLCLMISIRSCQRLTSDSMSLAAINVLRNIYCFDIYKFTDAENTQLASITRLLDAAEGEARIGMNLSVDETRAGFQQAGSDFLTLCSVQGKHGGSQTKKRVVRLLYGIRLVLRRTKSSHRAEKFLIIGRHALFDAGQHSGRIKRARPFGFLSSQHAACAFYNTFQYLLVKLIPQIPSRLGADIDIFFQRIAHFLFHHP